MLLLALMRRAWNLWCEKLTVGLLEIQKGKKKYHRLFSALNNGTLPVGIPLVASTRKFALGSGSYCKPALQFFVLLHHKRYIEPAVK